MKPELTHLDRHGNVRMVDVGDKEVTRRQAVAEAVVRMSPEAYRRLRSGEGAKGDAVAAARIAGIQAAKRTGELIPLCHAVPLDVIRIDVRFDDAENRVVLRASASARWFTGVEMEALTASSVAALTLYDMCKSADRGMTIEAIALVSKSGGRSGDYHRG